MTVNFHEIAKKWQKEWATQKTFEANADTRPKFFLTTPYPYVNGLLHIGHTYTYMRVDATARYRRMLGNNVLFAFGFHATGTPIETAAKRVREREEGQLNTLKLMGFTEKDWKNFEDPLYWISTFSKEAKQDLSNYGMSIDWRREFITTDLNPHYDKFIRWQFNKLKEKEYVIKSKHPVVWCPSCNAPTGDHARSEGEGEGPKDFIWVKFPVENSDLILMAGTTRPDALYAEKTLWVDPTAEYQIVNVQEEKWVVGKGTLNKIEQHAITCKEEGTIKAEELIGKKVKGAVTGESLYILPASFIDANMGSGLVYSALEDPFDYMEMKHIQEDKQLLRKYNLDADEMKKIQPKSIISVEGMGDDIGKEMCTKFNITSYEDKTKLEEAKAETNKLVFRKGIMKKNCGKHAGLTVSETQEQLKKELVETGKGIMFYELTGKVICRCLTDCHVKIVDDQWFLAYGNKQWKEQAHKCIQQMKLYPEKVRGQFEYVIDWLKDWACTREFGLGTNLPWEEKWKIESLSDSTIYTSYFTIAPQLEKLPVEKINDNFFDYLLLGKGNADAIDIDNKIIEEIKHEFEYWYPFDFYNSGKDLVQNHFAFLIFNHVAIFPEKYWPNGISTNGYVNINKQKMSKSKGNFKVLRDLVKEFGADVVRIGILSTGEDLNDVDWDSELAESMKNKLGQWYDFAIENYQEISKELRVKSSEKKEIDKWMEHQLHKIIKETTQAMNETLFRTAITKGFFDLQRHLKWYQKRTAGKMNAALVAEIIEAQTLMLQPFTPHLCEEIWQKIGKQGFISHTHWPTYDENKINPEIEQTETLMIQIIDDINHVLKLAKIDKPTNITFFVAENWKYDLFKKIQELIKETRDIKQIMQSVTANHKEHAKESAGLVQKIVKDPSKLPAHVSVQDTEHQNLIDATKFLKEHFRCTINIVKEQESKESKAKQAMPGKPAILVE
ncbi:leucine--tRNA ligase [Candidatus Woesearchaeota archaeon CG10_big_fil_rev_8_21_14_0_10_37_12]|nr:MAG: leucine--tRNA ligase [Candidatus Woesearchaeota archaeon CG10_big_fil_rev_8_21_14_0_10_37_12]